MLYKSVKKALSSVIDEYQNSPDYAYKDLDRTLEKLQGSLDYHMINAKVIILRINEHNQCMGVEDGYFDGANIYSERAYNLVGKNDNIRAFTIRPTSQSCKKVDFSEIYSVCNIKRLLCR